MWKKNIFITVLLWVISIISVGLCLYVFVKSSGQATESDKEELVKVINPMFVWVYVLVAVTILLIIAFLIMQVIENPKLAIGILVGLLGLGAVGGLSLLLAKSEALPFTPGHDPVSDWTIIFADVNIIAVYIMLGATILVMAGTSIWNIFKLR
ncbi:MAG: hypothetical protein LBG92_03260 [Prevotellaceae bacterium]|jgi:glucan phosphoethanolaminetransferase (alkaline phosphatase superfamily)|nr:hypothetical protein [Prevotellaceae bacterium]